MEQNCYTLYENCYTLYDGTSAFAFFSNGGLVVTFSSLAGRGSGAARMFPTIPLPTPIPFSQGVGVEMISFATPDGGMAVPVILHYIPDDRTNFRAYTFWLGIDGESEE